MTLLMQLQFTWEVIWEECKHLQENFFEIMIQWLKSRQSYWKTKLVTISKFGKFCLHLNYCTNFLVLIGGTLGVICVAFFMQGSGIFWSGNTSEPWIILGNNLLGLLTIFVWAGLWSTLIFGSLYAAKILRVDRETEFRGSDLVRDLKTI